MSTLTLSSNEIEFAFQSCNGKWDGCDWFTKFGKTELNLRAIRSSHALFMARATSGHEKADWIAAADWLAEIERHADEAAREAGMALKQVKAGDLHEAAHHAQHACDLEERYHPLPLWAEFLDAIENANRQSTYIACRRIPSS